MRIERYNIIVMGKPERGISPPRCYNLKFDEAMYFLYCLKSEYPEPAFAVNLQARIHVWCRECDLPLGYHDHDVIFRPFNLNATPEDSISIKTHVIECDRCRTTTAYCVREMISAY